MSGFIVHAFGFRGMLHIIAFVGLCYAPLMIFLRNPPAKDEKMVSYDSGIVNNLMLLLFLSRLVVDHERESQLVFIHT